MRKNSIKNTRVNTEVSARAFSSPSTLAYISVLGDEKARADTVVGLKSAEGYIRRQLAHNLNMRNTPEITFVLDQSIEYGVTMSKKIDDVTKDLDTDGEEDAE